jgi:hypothetical protein
LRGVFRPAHVVYVGGIRYCPVGAGLGVRKEVPVGNWRKYPFEERRLKINL